MHQQRLEETQQNALSLLKDLPLSKSSISTLWDSLGDDYFQFESPETIAWQTKLILEQKSLQDPIIAVQPHTDQGGTEIFIYAPDRSHLFAMCAATLDKLRLCVVQARILTAQNGFCLNTFVVLDSDGIPIHSPHRVQQITTSFKRLILPLLDDKPGPVDIPNVTHHIRRSLRFFKHQAHVKLTHSKRLQKSILEVHAPDFPGLLCRLGEAFMACDVFVHRAKINTLGKRVEDIFIISDRKTHRPIETEEAQLQLKSLILEKLSAFFKHSTSA